MLERRGEVRMLCADLVEVRWHDKSGRLHNTTANLEDISGAGACLQVEAPVPHGTLVRITHPKIEFEGTARYCVFRDTGYFIGVQFEPGTRWTRRRFRPQHMLDPGRLVARALNRS